MYKNFSLERMSNYTKKKLTRSMQEISSLISPYRETILGVVATFSIIPEAALSFYLTRDYNPAFIVSQFSVGLALSAHGAKRIHDDFYHNVEISEK